jgi:hypothetical protein
MNPLHYEPLADGRMDQAMERAHRWRLARSAGPAAVRSGLGSIRSAVGHGLIAVGERLVDPSTYRKAA